MPVLSWMGLCPELTSHAVWPAVRVDGQAHLPATELIPLSSIGQLSPLGRALGLRPEKVAPMPTKEMDAPRSSPPPTNPAAAAATDKGDGLPLQWPEQEWWEQSEADFELLIGQLLELVDTSYIQVQAAPLTIAAKLPTQAAKCSFAIQIQIYACQPRK